ncbi:sporulation inhibitor of replication protein SirA [Falsibacillus albus]|uniref:sporulation inhibitor of replication protein SirA n=1 Tax=Falsibacillus albus TaxID=2478915 RepID=UPI00131486A7|nr:sporulation inhibitor of replication protein SirA [Falsibacillus albus]
MRCYQIYFIEDEFAKFYYGREKMFFQLFFEQKQSFGELKYILDQQVHFITRPIPYLPFQRLLIQQMQKRKDLTQNGKCFKIGDSPQLNGAEMQIGNRMLQLNAWGSYDSEFAFFEVLRQFEGRLLAIDLENQRFGWVKPIKERKYV